MNIYGMVRQRMSQARQEKQKLKNIYNDELKKQKEIFAKEKAQIQVNAMKERAKVVAKEGRIKPVLTKIGKELKQHKQNKEKKIEAVAQPSTGPQFGLSGGSSSGPEFGLSKKKGGPKFDL